MEDYFDREVELTSAFSRSNEFEKLEVIKPIEANIFTLRQQHMMGTGNALMLVEPFVDKEPFVVAYPDDIVLGEKPLSKQLIETWEKTGNTVLSVQELEEDQLWRYGVIDPDGDGNIMNVKKMVEKPEHGTAPSRFVSFGRYLYTPELFDALRTSDKSHSSKSEFTQTEAINHMAALGKVSAVKFEGTRYDLGEPLGFLTSAMQIGLQRSEFKDTLLDEMRRLLELHDNPSDGNSD
jgi:UTP--glucose-1-phosphate uridylyltransferase